MGCYQGRGQGPLYIAGIERWYMYTSKAEPAIL